MSRNLRLRVGGVYINNKDEILLVRHEKAGRTYWLLPGGGCEYGEELSGALERELREECGLETRTGKLLFINESIPPDQHRHVINFTFLGEILSGEARLNEDDGVLREVAWVPRRKLETLTFYPNFKAELLRRWEGRFQEGAVSLGNVWEE